MLESILCPSCGAPIANGRQCGACGARVRDRADYTVRVVKDPVDQGQGASCLFCRNALESGNRFCPSCGKAQWWRCDCGIEGNRADRPYCAGCGSTRADAERREEAAERAQHVREVLAAQEARRLTRWFIAGGIVAALGVGWLVYLYWEAILIGLVVLVVLLVVLAGSANR